MITLEGYITTFEIMPASTDDREGLRDIVEGQSGLVILGDKGYVGEALTRELSDQGICLMALKQSNSKADWPRTMRQLIFKLWRRVETVFSQLSEQLNAERVLVKSFQGLCTRLANQILGYNLCLVLNSIFHETCELGKIKYRCSDYFTFNGTEIELKEKLSTFISEKECQTFIDGLMFDFRGFTK